MKIFARFLASCFLLLPATLAADTHDSEGYGSRPKIGVEAGLTLGALSAPNGVSASPSGGFTAGIVLDKPLVFFLSLRPEVLFVQKNTSLIGNDGSSAKLKYNALQIPLFAKLATNQFISPYLLIGPVIMLNLSSQKEVQIAGAASATTVNTFEAGAAIGAGLEIGPLFTNLRYLWALSNSNQSATDLRAQSLDILAGVRF